MLATGPSFVVGAANRPDQLSLPCGETKNSTAFGPVAKAGCIPLSQSLTQPAITAMVNASAHLGQYLRFIITLTGKRSFQKQQPVKRISLFLIDDNSAARACQSSPSSGAIGAALDGGTWSSP